MKMMVLSDGVVFTPESKLQLLALWFLSRFIGNYQKTQNGDSYPQLRRLKVYFKPS